MLYLFLTTCYSLLVPENNIWALDESNFQEALKSQDGLLVQFYSSSCDCCIKFAPEYTEIGKDLKKQKIYIAKVDASKHKAIASEYEIVSYPTFLYFINEIWIQYDGKTERKAIVDWVLKRKSNPYKFIYNNTNLKDLIDQKISVVYLGEFNHRFRRIFDTAYLNIEGMQFGLWNNTKLLENYNTTSPLGIVFAHRKQYEYKLSYSYQDFYKFIETHKPPKVYTWTNDVGTLIQDNAIPGILFFAEDSNLPKYQKTIDVLSEKYYQDLIFTTLDLNSNVTSAVKEFLGFTTEDQPSVVILDNKEKFYKYKSTDLSLEGVENFIKGWQNKTIEQYYKAQPEPAVSVEKRVRILVASNYFEYVNDTTKDVLVFFYDPRVDGNNLKIFERIAYEMKNRTDLVICKIDKIQNEFKDVELRGATPIKIYPKKGKRGYDYVINIGKFALFEFIDAYRGFVDFLIES